MAFKCPKCESQTDPFASKTIDGSDVIEFRCLNGHYGTIYVSEDETIEKMVNVELR